jgi:hypothetical protein
MRCAFDLRGRCVGYDHREILSVDIVNVNETEKTSSERARTDL